MSIQPLRLSRKEAVRLNDERIRQATLNIICEGGWDSATISGIAKRAGLTVGAVYGRADSVAELGIDLWSESLQGWFLQRLTAVLKAMMSGDPVALGRAYSDWDAQPVQAGASTELLLASLFDDELDEVIGEDVRTFLAGWCVPSDSRTRHEAGTLVLGLSFFFGHTLASRFSVSPHELSETDFGTLSRFWSAAPADVVSEPKPLVWQRSLNGLDPDEARLMQAVVEVVARVGYRRATFSRFARAAGMNRGVVANPYRNKAQLVAEAAHLLMIPPDEVWAEYRDVEAAIGPVESRAEFLKDFLRVSNRSRWALNLELARDALAVPELSEFAVPSGALGRTHLGVMLVASFLPDVHDLPYLGPFRAGITT